MCHIQTAHSFFLSKYQILQMKNIHKQISTLFVHEQQQQHHQDQILLKAEYLFAPFRGKFICAFFFIVVVVVILQ